MGWIAVHRKAILGALAALGGICSVVAVHQEWGQIAQWAGIIVAVLAAAGVYRVPNQMAQPAPANLTVTRPATVEAPVTRREGPPPG